MRKITGVALLLRCSRSPPAAAATTTSGASDDARPSTRAARRRSSSRCSRTSRSRRHRGQGPLRRQRRARGDDRRGGRPRPADVFFAQDPGSVGSVEQAGRLATLPQPLLDRVPERFRDPDGHWVGTSGRVRVVAYNTDELKEDDCRTRSSATPTEVEGQDRIRADERLLPGVRDGDAPHRRRGAHARSGSRRSRTTTRSSTRRTSRSSRRSAAARSRSASSTTTTSSSPRRRSPNLPVANDYLPGDDPGALVSVAAVGILESSDTRTRPSGSSSSCCPTRASASTPRRPRRPSTRSSRASSRRRACRRSTALAGARHRARPARRPSSRRRSSC